MIRFSIGSRFSEDGDVAVYGFLVLRGNETGFGVAEVGDLYGAETLEGGAGLAVFEVEVGGDDEHAVTGETVKAAIEHALPKVVAVPEVLMTKEGDVELLVVVEVVEDLEAIA